MKHILVLYHTRSHNTSGVARAIALGARGTVFAISDSPPSYDIYDIVIIGTPVHGGKPDSEIQEFLKTFRYKGKLAFFCTWGAPVWGPGSVKMCFRWMKDNTGGEVLGTFSCRGMHQIIKTYRGHPDKKDLADARAFGKKMARKL